MPKLALPRILPAVADRWFRSAMERYSTPGVDWLPAIGITVVSEFSIWVHNTTGDIPGPKPIAGVLYLALGLALGFRRQLPVVALGLALAACLWEVLRLPVAEQGSFEVFLALCLGTYAMGAHAKGRVALLAGLLLPAAVPIADTAHRAIVFDEGWHVSEIVPFWIWSAAFCAVGRGVRNRHIMIGLLGERADRLEREREQQARAAVAEERSRIARELHDVVAHAVSVMVVQAGAARRVMSADAEQAERSLLAVEATGRQALGEMRRLLGVLRTDPEGLSLAPQPGLGQVGELVEHVRSAGVEVELRNEGESRPLPAGVDLVAYRVIQEGLTNVLKHAEADRATVSITYRPDAVDLEVRDDGRGGQVPGDGRGHGLFGMRERVGLYGGRVEAGAGNEGGFVVSASIPTADAR